MRDFISTVKSERLRQLLENAITGRGAFRRFKNVLSSHPAEMHNWQAFKDERLKQRIIAWLDEYNVGLSGE